MGEVAATKSGIARWAQIRNENSERDVHRVVKKQRTSLNIPIDEMNVRGKSLPWINPRAWLEYIVSHGLLYMLSGLQFENRHLVETYWTEFWARYETLNPDYGLFDIDTIDRADYGRVIGLFIHGDEGRTLKKQGLMVTSIQSVLGSGFSSKRLKRPAVQMMLVSSMLTSLDIRFWPGLFWVWFTKWITNPTRRCFMMLWTLLLNHYGFASHWHCWSTYW